MSLKSKISGSDLYSSIVLKNGHDQQVAAIGMFHESPYVSFMKNVQTNATSAAASRMSRRDA